MAIRYSGDVEVRMSRRGRIVIVLMRTPRKKMGTRYVVPGHVTSEGYDRIAVRALTEALRRFKSLPVERHRSGRIHIRRVFVSPCPKRI